MWVKIWENSLSVEMENNTVNLELWLTVSQTTKCRVIIWRYVNGNFPNWKAKSKNTEKGGTGRATTENLVYA